MTGDAAEGASDSFFDDFNKDRDKQALTEEVNRKLCEVLTELAENIVDAIAEAVSQRQQPAGVASGDAGAGAAAGPTGSEAAAAETAVTAAAEDEGADAAGSDEVDEVAAMAAYNDALAAIMREQNVSSKDLCALPDEHPLKELFFSAFDPNLFHELLTRFIGQVRARKEGPGEWDAEAAEGECDEDHTLE